MAKNKTSKELYKALEASEGSIEDFVCSYVETGGVGIDLAITNGKGVPLGDWITIFAGYASGKSTILADMLRRALLRHEKMNIPFKAVYFDIENSKGLLKSTGLAEHVGKNLIYYRGRKTWEQLDSFFEKLLEEETEKYKDVKIVVIDSATAVISEKDVEMNCGDARFGTKAAACTRCLEKYIPLLEQKGVTVIVTAQTRDNMDQGFGQPDQKAAISNALKFYSTVIMKLIKKVSTQDTDVNKIVVQTAFGEVETPEKFIITLQTTKGECKNRHGHIPDVDIMVQFGKRVINAYTVKKMLKNWGVVQDNAGNFTLPEGLVEGVSGDKKLKRVEYNKFLSENIGSIVNYLKENDLYRVKKDSVGEDSDGFI